jgi:hypothetical protein
VKSKGSVEPDSWAILAAVGQSPFCTKMSPVKAKVIGLGGAVVVVVVDVVVVVGAIVVAVISKKFLDQDSLAGVMQLGVTLPASKPPTILLASRQLRLGK